MLLEAGAWSIAENFASSYLYPHQKSNSISLHWLNDYELVIAFGAAL